MLRYTSNKSKQKGLYPKGVRCICTVKSYFEMVMDWKKWYIADLR